jgi:hypothetical protein
LKWQIVVDSQNRCSQIPNDTILVYTPFLPIYPLPPPLIGSLSLTFLTHICRQWREIALATPALWRAISLFGNYLPRKIISSMLSRSGWCPLSIQMDDPNERDEHEHLVPPGSDILAAILPYRARGEYLKLVLTGRRLPAIGGVPLTALQKRCSCMSMLPQPYLGEYIQLWYHSGDRHSAKNRNAYLCQERLLSNISRSRC